MIYSMENLVLAEKNARKGKSRQYGVRLFDQDPQAKLMAIQESLRNRTYSTSPYKTFTIYEPKERIISALPYKDRIVHHAIMNHLEKVFTDTFTADTYSCIKGKGIGGFDRNFKKALRDAPGTQYALQIDIKKFYPSIDHTILKQLLRRKFKDQDLLWLLDEIIDSAPGVPIGNYLSQFFANFYLTGLDHFVKQELGARYYFRYSDDMVLLAETKPQLHYMRVQIFQYLANRLKLQAKDNYRVFPVDTGVDVVGKVYRHSHIRLRKSIKQRFARAMARKNINIQTWAAYWGWAKHANTKHLIKKLICQKQKAA